MKKKLTEEQYAVRKVLRRYYVQKVTNSARTGFLCGIVVGHLTLLAASLKLGDGSLHIYPSVAERWGSDLLGAAMWTLYFAVDFAVAGFAAAFMYVEKWSPVKKSALYVGTMTIASLALGLVTRVFTLKAWSLLGFFGTYVICFFVSLAINYYAKRRMIKRMNDKLPK
jgi:hypothetical protein